MSSYSTTSYESSPLRYPGIGRLAYIGNCILFMLIGRLMEMFLLPETLVNLVLLGIFIWGISVSVLRLQNIGKSGWWVLGNFVPLLNFYIGFLCLCAPAGYNDSRELDTAGKIIASILIVLIVLTVLSVTNII